MACKNYKLLLMYVHHKPKNSSFHRIPKKKMRKFAYLWHAIGGTLAQVDVCASVCTYEVDASSTSIIEKHKDTRM